MHTALTRKNTEQVTKYADLFSAMGTQARLRIMQLLLTAHPEGLVVGEIQEELEIANFTLSHHLDKLQMRAWWPCAARARSCAIEPIPKRSRNCSSSCMRNAALAIKL